MRNKRYARFLNKAKGVNIKELFLDGINKAITSIGDGDVNFNENVLNYEEHEILNMYYKILKRVKNEEFIIDAFFREIQYTRYEEMMVKKPIIKRKSDVKEAFRGCIYVFVNGDKKEDYLVMINDLDWLGIEFSTMCMGVLKYLK